MKILVEQNDERSFSIKIPNWLLLSRIGLHFLAKNIAKNGGVSIKLNFDGDENENLEPVKVNKKEFKASVKKTKRSLIGARAELRAFIKRHPDFVLVDVLGSDGEHVKVSF